MKEGIDFSYNAQGQMVFHSSFLIRRGYCCKSGCQNCPYEEGNNLDPNIPLELIDKRVNYDEDHQKYIEMAEDDI